MTYIVVDAYSTIWGEFDSEADAQAEAARLQAEDGLTCWVVGVEGLAQVKRG